jgi:tetratricopeptide (TPR) repeat protein
MRELWDFVVKNKETLALIGGGIAAIAGAVWTIIAHFFPANEGKSKGAAATTATVTQSGTGIASGRDVVISGRVNIGLDEKENREQIAAELRSFKDQLVAEIADRKGVPIAPLRAILVKLGEAGVAEEIIPQRLDAKADELLRLRDEIALLRQGPAELASFAQRAQDLIDQGELDATRTALADGRASARKLREQSSRYEAAFLAREAGIDHLQLAYRSAAAKYLEAAALVADIDLEKRWQFLRYHALELCDYGNEFGDNDALLQAIAVFRAMLTEYFRNRMPLDWAGTQNNLGSALSMLGGREGSTARLEEAVAAFRAALTESARERVPLDWAATQNNLGNALLTLGGHENGTACLEEAVAAYRAALTERTRERVPHDWAATKNNLGNALLTLGKRENSTAHVEEAVAAFRAALTEFIRERVPLDWAMTQTNLANALGTLGERESGTARLEEAVAAIRAALTERTRERVPLDWAATQNSLGNALARLGERENDTAQLEEAVAAFGAALAEFTRERVPLSWAMTQTSLGTALRTLGERDGGTAQLEEAVAAFHAALTERTRERVPFDWAVTQTNLGVALAMLGERESGTARLEDAVVAFHASLSVDTYFNEWTRERLARVEGLLAERSKAPSDN